MKMATQPSGWAGSDLPAAPAKLTKQTPSSWCVVPRCSNICSLWKTAEEFRLRLWFLSNDALKIDVIRSKTSWGYKFFPLIVEQQRDEPSQKQHAFLQPSLNWRFLSNQNTGKSSSRHLPSLMILSGNYINSFHTLDPFLLMWSMTSFSWGTYPTGKGFQVKFPMGAIRNAAFMFFLWLHESFCFSFFREPETNRTLGVSNHNCLSYLSLHNPVIAGSPPRVYHNSFPTGVGTGWP